MQGWDLYCLSTGESSIWLCWTLFRRIYSDFGKRKRQIENWNNPESPVKAILNFN